MYMKVLREQIHATCAILHTPVNWCRKNLRVQKSYMILLTAGMSDRKDGQNHGMFLLSATQCWGLTLLSESESDTELSGDLWQRLFFFFLFFVCFLSYETFRNICFLFQNIIYPFN